MLFFCAVGEGWALLLSVRKSVSLTRHSVLRVNRKISSRYTEEAHPHFRFCLFSVIQGSFIQFSDTSWWSTHFESILFQNLSYLLGMTWKGRKAHNAIKQYDATSFALPAINGAFRKASEAQVQAISGFSYLRNAIIFSNIQCPGCLRTKRK